MAVDCHAPSIARLTATLAERGLASRVQAIVGDMADPKQPPGSFDLVWSEGALYTIGIAKALRIGHDLQRPGGYLAFTDTVWRTENPPPAVKASFEDDPTMGRADDVVAIIQASELALIDHFPLPDAAWWDDFYTPMEQRIDDLRRTCAQDAEALAILEQIAEEPAMHHRSSEHSAYAFSITRRPSSF